MEVDDTPTGVVYPFAGAIANIPSGYLLCNGSSLLRASYPALFNAIGVIYGAADGTHFNLPDFRDRMLIGARQDDSGTPKTNVTGALTANGGSIMLTHSGASVNRGASGISVDNHASHVHAGPASTHFSVKQIRIIFRHSCNNGHLMATLATQHPPLPTQITEPNGGAGHDHDFTQPNDHTAIPPYFAIAYIIKT